MTSAAIILEVKSLIAKKHPVKCLEDKNDTVSWETEKR